MVPAIRETTKIQKPRVRALDDPATTISTQGATILSPPNAIAPIRRDELHIVFGAHLGVLRITVVSAIANQEFGEQVSGYRVEDRVDEFDLRGRGAFDADAEWSAMAIDNHHALGAFAGLRWTNAEPPFLAAAKLPSMKHSSSDRPPRMHKSLRSVMSPFSLMGPRLLQPQGTRE